MNEDQMIATPQEIIIEKKYLILLTINLPNINLLIHLVSH